MHGTSRATRSYVVVPASADFGGDATALEGITLYASDGSAVSYAGATMPLQADVAAFTSSAAAGSTPTKAEFDALRTDALASRTAINSLLDKLKTAGLMATS